MRIANYTVLAVVMVCNLWVFISTFISCIPLEAVWNPAVKGKCLGVANSLSNTIVHIVTDFVIFVLPLPVLLKLKMNLKRKIGLVLVFSLGFL
jgi:hypothetical protein